MLAWMLYVVVVTAFLSGAAFAAERSAYLRRAPTRWLWGVAIVASLLVPTVISSVSIQIPSLSSAFDYADATRSMPLRQFTSQALVPSAWLMTAAGPVPLSTDVDTGLTRGWQAASALLVMAILCHGWLLNRRSRGWRKARISGVDVYIAEDMGPAVVGLLRPRIVLPGWLCEMPAAEQELVIAHERAHLQANDARLLAIAILLIVTMPWNLPLWWQLRRLRLAIEVDCDARVLEQGHEIPRYGATLLMVGERQSNPITVVAGMAESKSFLEKRIRKMVSKRTKFAWVSATGLGCLGLAFVACAAEVSPPNADTAQAPVRQVAVDPQVLARYVGFYKLGDNNVLTITDWGGQLFAQMNGMPELPILARSPTDFAFQYVKVSISFVTDAQGHATALVMHRNGEDTTMPRVDGTAAAQINQRAEAKFRSGTQSPGTEAALRRMIEGYIKGEPAFDAMSPGVAAAMRQQWHGPDRLSKLGAIKSITFLGTSPQGADVYTVWQENGATRWNISVDEKGAITAAWNTPGP